VGYLGVFGVVCGWVSFFSVSSPENGGLGYGLWVGWVWLFIGYWGCFEFGWWLIIDGVYFFILFGLGFLVGFAVFAE